MMHNIVQVTLENEMDLILAHKRTMKLAELAGLSLPAQTTFATAVSEVSRSILESGKSGSLILNIETDQGDKYIVASLTNERSAEGKEREGLEYAKKLVNKFNVSTHGSITQVQLFYYISPPFRLDAGKLNEWRTLFRNEPPISPYEELKRKNEQLQLMSDNLQKSEAQYKTLTNSLPLIIFSLNNEGSILYANEWLARYTGQTIDGLNRTNWKTVVHEDDYDAFSLILKNDIAKGASAIKTQSRLKSKSSGEYYWHQISLGPFKDEKGELLYWIGFIVDIHAQKVVEETLKDNYELKQARQKLEDNQLTLKKYIEELNRSNYELQQFAFVASHDLQEPVRKLLYYSDHLLNRYSNALDSKALDHLKIVSSSSHRMRNLIKDLLLFSQVSKEKIQFSQVDLNEVAKEVCTDLDLAIANKKAVLNIEPLPVIEGDMGMMRQLFGNIISNSLKYSKADSPPVIEISCLKKDSTIEIAFKDNGIGFDQKYLSQMFTLFQRLHGRESYEGTGLGLAICRKIVDLHQGRIWAEAKEGQGAVFYVSLPIGLNR